ncbi:MAG: carboxypeptidase-like regulatory domain-containing protein [Acidobacteriia bacterium]|nr:carboxypeptidase-like regulatory domain-containing protein [Terriglobia bacterium]
MYNGFLGGFLQVASGMVGRRRVRCCAATAVLLALALAILAQQAPAQAAPSDDLKLLISLEQLTIATPYPARVTLQFHNGGKAPLYLYRRARSQAGEGSALEVRLDPLGAPSAQEINTPARGSVFESVGLPRPKLVRLDADEDTAEKATIQLLPAQSGPEGNGTSLWGRYRLSVIYRARYSNGADLERILGIALWQGELESNSVEIELQAPTGQGSIAGNVARAEGGGIIDALVSLSDEQERLVAQAETDADGRYRFTHLSLGVYWVTVRRPNIAEDTVVFRHIELTPSDPEGSIEFVMSPPETYEAEKILHKPVVLRVTDSKGAPLGKVRCEIVWTNGPVIENAKGETNADGLIVVELIPGPNFLTLSKRGCTKQEQRVEVAQGGGIDGFKSQLDCEKE